jgi:hypothetical protein
MTRVSISAEALGDFAIQLIIGFWLDASTKR